LNEIEQPYPNDFANSLEVTFARLQVAVLDACDKAAPWPAKVATAVQAALDFAAANPAAAKC
jgi:hypothetical protein